MANKTGLKQPVSPAILGVVVVLLALFIGWLAYANLFAPPKAPPMTPEAEKRNAEYLELAKKTRGDVSKLSPEEYNKFMKETGGYGASILRKMAKDNGY